MTARQLIIKHVTSRTLAEYIISEIQIMRAEPWYFDGVMEKD